MLNTVLEPPLLRRSIYFAGSVFVVMEFANFPIAFDDWKQRAVAVSAVNVVIFANAVAAGLLALRMLRARGIGASTLVAAGVVSSIELIQFAPFTFPSAFSRFGVAVGILCAFVPMFVTLLIFGYLFSKRKVSIEG